ncbi:MAG TPA: putative 2-aminoethylphosphonate ABC transporter substrate-binding protein [Casimicrobiaceae bacterium]|nr:putative 2-aminoethylphosphonate ABC transporter substrate-binding protein [Casimicrobiaceae bacterium]
MQSASGKGWTRLATATLALVVGLLSSSAAAQKTELLVYTALETDQIKAYETAFYAAVPDVTIKWVRDSTGIITAKVLAEKANPQADLVVGTSASSMAVFANEGLLQGYAPKGLDKILPQYRDPKNPPEWVGMDVYGAAVCFNTVEAQKQNLPKPESWKDLTKPVYKGKIVMPNPASSGTGFLDVAGWLQMWGEADGWKFMDALHENVAQYVHSGSAPCRSAGSGEFPIGISFEYRAVTTKKSGAPIDIIFPSEGLGWDLEASGIMKTTKKVEAARKLMDWLATPQAMELFSKNFAVVAIPGIAKPLDFVPADYEKRLVKNDFAWEAKNRDRILAEWTKRYDSKSAKK